MNAQKKRMALVIGNSDYLGDSLPVSGAENAVAMRDCLKTLDFTVFEPILNAGLTATRCAVDNFANQIVDADVVLLFYSGHGTQIGNRNFLIPVGGSVSFDEALPLDEVIQKLANAPNAAVKLVFVDACRDNLELPEGFPSGFTEPSPAPAGTLQAYSASPGQLAESGEPPEVSVYTEALVELLLEPGLRLVNLFERLRIAVVLESATGQRTFEAGELPPDDFFFRDPVDIRAVTHGWPHAQVLVVLNGEIALSTAEASDTPLRLNAGENRFALLVASAKNFAGGGQSWTVPAGWSYHLDLVLPDGTYPIRDEEPTPFKDGPHHGGAFNAAQAIIDVRVEPVTAKVKVTLRDVDKDVWRRQTPIWALHQEPLFEETITNLNLTPDDLLGEGTSLSRWAPLLRPLIAEFLKSGKILGQKVADPARTFAMVWGNRALRGAVQHCMTAGRADRVRDLKAAIAAVLARASRPFEVFDQGLIACIRETAKDLPGFRSEDLRIWTAIQERREPASDAAAADTSGVPALMPPPSPESLRALAQDGAFLPRDNEVLLERRLLEESVQGVPITIDVHTFLSVDFAEDHLLFHARSLADLSDFQNKIGAVIDTIPLPTDNCSRFAVDNIVARIWGKQITVDGDTGTLKLNGDVEVWTCVKNPIPCSRIDWEERRGPFGIRIRVPVTTFYDCNPPIKNRNLSQSFEAKLPFTLGIVDADTYGLRLGNPSIDLGGPLGGVTEGILRIAGVDINAEAKNALERAINPEALRQNLPDFLLAYNPTLVRADLFSNSGALAASLEMDVKLDFLQAGELIQALFSRQEAVAAGG